MRAERERENLNRCLSNITSKDRSKDRSIHLLYVPTHYTIKSLIKNEGKKTMN